MPTGGSLSDITELRKHHYKLLLGIAILDHFPIPTSRD